MAWLMIGLVWLLGAAVLVGAGRFARLWSHGRPARIDWTRGLLALPRRYLVDVHHVVERRPGAGRMHVLAAGGLLGSLVLVALALVPPLGHSRFYWALVLLVSLGGLVGAALVRARRVPVRPSYLSGGMFNWLAPVLAAVTGAIFLLAACQVALPAALLQQDITVFATGLLAVGAVGLLAVFLSGPMRHAFAGSTWLVTHSRPARFGGGRDTALRPLDLDQPVLGAVTPGDFAWNVLSSFDACIQCGRCEEACPAFAAGQRLNPKALIQGVARAMHDDGWASYTGSPAPNAPPVGGHGGMDSPVVGVEAMIHPDTLWACTTCRACVEECPMMIEHVDTVIDLRRGQALMHGDVRPGAAQALRHMRDSAEPGGRPLSERADALAALDVPVLGEGEETDILLWLGEGAYDRRYGRSLQALVRLMQHAGLRFAILGAAETDSGDLARRLGDEATFQMLARDVIATLGSRRFSRIVTADPHSLHVLRNEYPALGGQWTVMHHTALLDELVGSGRLTLSARDLPPVAWHDPCYLARYNGETEAPRRLLSAACSRTVEMERHGTRAMCCGGGGGNPVSDVDAQERIPDLRMGQAQDAGAQIVAVGCPGCTAMLEGVTGARPEVRDIAELVLDAMVRP
ncbi:DUF3483 domain-containing protein [Komagataeibacter sp. FNDCF1]|uniref:DUF3483 domain-containing protein n=1 Tax=Komagataeibacter sp. FNDCF1 TaxID=2878681 RepID=UPI001E5B2E08|nr:DUF3483 domain-containing protein [Komagataeibacter sp. FNDCF1]MCE2565134.1 (Fe-S)-binding protein [Komagataeibacter sp. FNDCF1]